MAKTYLQLNPTVNLVVLESQESVGGVWAEERLYSGLRMNNEFGSYEYGDFPMDGAKYGVKKGQHIPGNVVHRYLRAYSDEYHVHPRIRFKSTVTTIEKSGKKGWAIHYDTDDHPGCQIFTSKLVIATGVTSAPAIPKLRGAEDSEINVIHSKYLKTWEKKIQNSQRIAILGGGKSAYDVAHLAASKGVEVSWIIRGSGQGAAWMVPSKVALKKNIEELVSTRACSWMSPCVWGDAHRFQTVRWFLHGTRIGRWMVSLFWIFFANYLVRLAGYDRHPDTQKLKPWIDVFWSANSLSVLNHPGDIFEFVRQGKIKVYISDVSHLAQHSVVLANGQSIECDFLVCSTGWKGLPSMRFLPEGIEAEIGIVSKTAESEILTARADEEVLRRYPFLQKPPTARTPITAGLNKAGVDSDVDRLNPKRVMLYRFMVPPRLTMEHNIGFAGIAAVFYSPINAQVQALWLTAYLTGQLPISKNLSASEKETLEWETALHNQFCKWRYPYGSKGTPDYILDILPHMDLLLGDLGLKSHRKGSWWAECFKPYIPGDYCGLVEEWRALNAKEKVA
ncbi:hypothetical protein FQN57_000809 [Myotisia sp. PD_48]|nr:hypothetical protein FQN57_000809 [Myotisia sp. PD_48]